MTTVELRPFADDEFPAALNVFGYNTRARRLRLARLPRSSTQMSKSLEESG